MGDLSQTEAIDLGARRVPWRAGLLGVLTVGLGHIYSGRPLRGAALYLTLLVIALSCNRLIFFLGRPWNIVAPPLILLAAWLLILADAGRCAKRAPAAYNLRCYNRWYVYLLLIVVGGLCGRTVASFAQSRIEKGFKTTEKSMSPAILPGDYFMVDFRAYLNGGPRDGDIVAFRYPPNPSILFVKRVVGVGGETVKIADDHVYIDGRLANEPFAQFDSPGDLPLQDNFPPPASFLDAEPSNSAVYPTWAHEMTRFIQNGTLRIPKGNYFVLGDNRDDSLDSRYWGFVPRGDILGRARAVYFSRDPKTGHIRWRRIGDILR